MLVWTGTEPQVEIGDVVAFDIKTIMEYFPHVHMPEWGDLDVFFAQIELIKDSTEEQLKNLEDHGLKYSGKSYFYRRNGNELFGIFGCFIIPKEAKQKKCDCKITDLMYHGCKCGGV